MDARERAFLLKLRETFRLEAAEHLRLIDEGLVELEQAEAQGHQVILESVFREAHSFKGAARSVNLTAVETLCQSLEGVFSALKQELVQPSRAFFDASHKATGLLARLVEVQEDAVPPSDQAEINTLTDLLSSIAAGKAVSPIPTPVAPEKKKEQPAQETVRVATVKLDPVLLQAEEFLQVTLSAQQRLKRLRELSSLRTSSEVQESLAALTKTAEEDFRALKRLTDEHLASTRRLLLLPVSSMVEGFPKLVRDLSRDKGKESVLVMSGTEVEIDKRILDEIKGPIVHLLRNCIDHGIEPPDARLKADKKKQGTVRLDFALKDSRRLEIVVSDDGAGIDVEGVLAAAVVAGAAGSAKTPQDILPLVFRSGVSVSPVTEISGRGLGLAIVREKAEALGGTVAVESVPGLGTTFQLDLPLTLATFHGVFVDVRGSQFVIPSANVDRVFRVNRSEIATVGNQETVAAGGQVLSLIDLGDALGLKRPRTVPVPEEVFVVVVVHGNRRMAYRVDEILEEQQMLLKSLGRQLVRVKNIAGVTLLGSGVVPVLNASDLLGSEVLPAVQTAPEPARVERSRILVAEDSITTRAMLRNILEMSGYLVTTAADGMEALELFRKEPFQLVVSDVDMPRMNGFELTARIRTLGAGTQTPIVLVTSLESKEDRERGLDAGASAYLVKSGFDRNNLLTVLGRLLGEPRTRK